MDSEVSGESDIDIKPKQRPRKEPSVKPEDSVPDVQPDVQPEDSGGSEEPEISDYGSHVSELWNRLVCNDAGDVAGRNPGSFRSSSRGSSRTSRSSRSQRANIQRPKAAWGRQSRSESEDESGRIGGGGRGLRQGLYTVKATEKIERMGWAPSAWPPNQVFVGSVTSTWASGRGIGVGDELVEIDGRRPKDMVKADLVAMIQKRPLSMTFKRHPLEDSDADLEEWDGEKSTKKGAATAKAAMQQEDEEEASIQTLIAIHHARDLTSTDESGFADPYVVCQIVKNPELNFSTRVKRRTVNPNWSHKELLYGISGDDQLEFLVWDMDKEDGTKDLIGFTQLDGAMFWPDGFEGDLTLEGGGTLHVTVEPGHGDDDDEQQPQTAKKKKQKKLPDDAFEILLQHEKRMGFAPTAMPPEPVLVDNIEQLGWAAEHGLRPGDELVGVDGLLVQKMEPKAFLAALRNRPVRLAFRRTAGTGPIEITIMGAKNLRSADFMGKSDPFCVCEVPGKPTLKIQTPCVNDTNEPVWNFRQMLDVTAFDNIEFKVYDKDVRGEELLGMAVLDHTQYRPDGFDGKLELDESAGPGSFLLLRVNMLEDKYALAPPEAEKLFEMLVPEYIKKMGWTPSGLPPDTVLVQNVVPNGWAERSGVKIEDELMKIEGKKVQSMKDVTFMRLMKERPLKLTFSRKIQALPAGGRVRIMIKSAKGLRSADFRGKADPFVICEVPSRPENTFQTPVQTRTLDPVWNYTHELWNVKTIPFLQFSIWDQDKGEKGELLGKVTIPKGKFWPSSFNGDLVLSEAGTKEKATLQLSIEVLADDSPEKPTAFELTVGDFVKNLGFRPGAMPPNRVFVEHVQPSLWAATQGVRAGDELVEIEGTYCVEMNEADFQTAMNIRPLRLGFVRAPVKKAKETGKKQSKIDKRPIEVIVEEAKDLRSADLGGTSDPYCEVQILDRPETKFTTPVCENSLNPVWHHRDVIRGCQADEILVFSVFDKDPGRKGDLLGKVILPVTVFWPNSHEEALLLEETKGKKSSLYITAKVLEAQADVAVYEKMFTLTAKAGQDILGFQTTGEPPKPVVVDQMRKGGWAEKGGVQKGDVLIASDGKQVHTLSNQGLLDSLKIRPLRLQFARPTESELNQEKAGSEAGSETGRWQEDTSWLLVTVVSAKNLRQADWLGASDPFVVCEIPGLPGESFKTKVQKDTINPVWNHEYGFGKVPIKATLKFTVFDSDPGGKTDLLGKVLLPSEQYYPNGFHGDLVLEDSKRGDMATLKVQVEVMKEDLQEVVRLEQQEQKAAEKPDAEKEEWEFVEQDEGDEIYGRATDGQYELRADFSVENMGWGPSGMPPERMLVREVKRDGWAAKRGMQIGDELVKVEGRNVRDIQKKHVPRIFNLRPLHMVFERGVGDDDPGEAQVQPQSGARKKGYEPDPHNLEKGFFEVVAKKGVSALGLRTTGMPPARIFILSVKPKTWAGRSGLREHDEIVEINGCTASAVGDFVGSLQSRPLRLLISRGEGTDKEDNQEQDHGPDVLVELVVPQGSRVGWMPSGLPPEPVHVLKVERHSVAYKHKVQEGDELLRVNNLDLDVLDRDAFMKEFNKRPLKLLFRLHGQRIDELNSGQQASIDAEDDEDITSDWDIVVKDVVGYDDVQVQKFLDFVAISFGGEVDAYKLTEAVDFRHAQNMGFISTTVLKRDSTIEHLGRGNQDVILKVFIAKQDQNLYGFKYVGFAHDMQPTKRAIHITAGDEYRQGYYLGLEVHRNLNSALFSLKGSEVAQEYVRKCLRESNDICNGVSLEVLPEHSDFLVSFADQSISGINALLKFLVNAGARSGPWGAYPKKVQLCTAYSLGLGKHFQGNVELCFGRIDFGLQPADFSGQWFWEYTKASRRTTHGVLVLHPGTSSAVVAATRIQSRGEDLRNIEESRLFVFDQKTQRIVSLAQFYSTEMKTGSQVTRAAHLGDTDTLFSLIWEDAGAVLAADGTGRTPLHMAATTGDVAVVGWLLRAKAVINAVDQTNETPLYNAAAEGHSEIVQILLDVHADTEIRSVTGRTAYRIAQERSHGCLSLLRNSEDPEFNTEGSVRSRAVAIRATLQNDIRLLDDIFMSDSRAVRATDSQGKSLLHVAAQCGHVKLGEFLLDRDANINARDCQKFTPLHSAANEGRVAVVQMLLVKHSDIEARAQGGYTALDCALLQAQILQRQKQIPKNFSNTIRLLRSAGTPESDLRRAHLQ